MKHRDAVQTARETLVILRREVIEKERQIAATETFIAAMTGRAPGEAHRPRPRLVPTPTSRRQKIGEAHKRAVLEALHGTEKVEAAMLRSDITELCGIDTGTLSRTLAALMAEDLVVQANPGAKRYTRFKLKTDADREAMRLRVGEGVIS